MCRLLPSKRTACLAIASVPWRKAAPIIWRSQSTRVILSGWSSTMWEECRVATILIVDDQPDTLYILDRLLKGQGHTVLTPDRGQLALDIARHDHPDLVL